MASNSIIAYLYPLSSSILNTKSFFQSHCFSSPKSRNSSLSLYGDEVTRRTYSQTFITPRNSPLVEKTSFASMSRKLIPRCSGSSNVGGGKDEPPNQNKTPFGYTRKDVILIGVGLTVVGVGLKSGLEYVGVDPLQAGNVVQLVLVLGLTVGWISTYIFRVSNKEMTYAQQLRDYEDKVMQKRLESLTEAEIQALLEQVEEEKTRLASGEK